MRVKIALGLIMALAIILRLNAYLAQNPLWLDECSLTLSIMNRGFWGYFAPLEHVQSAPPFFMMATKVVTMIFGENELALRFIPFLGSVLAVFAFYFVSKEFFKKTHSLLLANFLFAINYRLIYFSQEFKQYSTDVFCVLLALFALSKVDLKNTKQAIVAGVLSFALMLFSLPVAFVSAAFILMKFKQKRTALPFFLPWLVFGPFYYIFSLLPSKKIMLETYQDLWASGFIALHPLGLLMVVKSAFEYLFYPNTFTLLAILLFATGIIITIKERKAQNALYTLMLLTLSVAMVASVLHIYPIKERVALYLLPVFLLFMLKPLDIISTAKKAASTLVLGAVILYFSNISYLAHIFDKNYFKRTGAKEAMRILKGKYDHTKDVLVYNDASKSIYAYYGSTFGFFAKNFVQINLVQYDKDFYMSLLNQLPKNHTYWFYYAYDYHKKPVIPYIKEWAEGKTVEVWEENGSYLAKIKL